MKKLLSFAGVALLALTVGCDDDKAVTPPVAPPTPAPIFGTVSGTVTVEGSGLVGVSVNLSGAASQSASTGSSGGYSFDNVPAGTHSVQISGAPDEVNFGSTATAVTITTSGQTATADFSGTYIRTARITGSVTAGGEGVVATVTATGAGMLMSQQAVLGSSGTDGNFELPDLRAGTYTVTISEFGDHEFVVTSRAVTLAVGQSASVAFVAEAVEVTTGSITGQVVTAAGVGIVATVTAVGTGEGGVTVAGSSDTEGDYELPGVEAGDYTVTISEFSDDHEFTVSSRAVTVVAGQSSSVTFVAGPEPEVTTGSITGQVVTAAGVGIVATVTAVGTGEGGVTVAGSSDTEGDYELPGVEAGDYTVTISEFSDDHEFDVSSRTVTVVAGQSSSVTFVAEAVPTTGTGTGLSLIITGVTDDDDDNDKTSGRVTATIDVERGEFEKIALYVDGAEVDAQLFGLGPAPAGEPPLAAQQGVVFNLSFNSAKYDSDTGEVTYPNGAYEIVAGVTVKGSTEEAYSNRMEIELDNEDAVYVAVSGHTKLPVLGADGGYWYGGPDAGFDLSAVPVVYSERLVPSVTLRMGFCGENDAVSLTNAPYTFTPDCDGWEGPVEAESFSIGAAPVMTLNADDEVFSIQLDYKAPGAPWFKPNPNGRYEGWINDAVGLTAKHVTSGSKKNLNGWLMAGDGAGGVGGNTFQIRYAAVPKGSSDKGLEAALAATPSVDPMVPAASKKKDAYCFVASATDLLGNESKRPDPDDADDIDTCPTVADFMDAMEAVEANPDPNGDGNMDDAIVAVDAEDAVVFSAILAGVDKTAPTVIFTGASPKENARELATNFQLHVSDDEDGSGLVEDPDLTDDVIVSAVRARYEIRKDNDKGMVCVDSDALPGVEKAGECKSDAVGLTRDPETGPLFTATGTDEVTDVGYYTLTASASDKAGNKSPEVSRTALHDDVLPVASLIVTKEDADTYNKILVAADGLSIQDYTVTMGATNLPADTDVRLATVPVDEYNGRPLSTARTVSGPVELPFSAVQEINNGAPAAFASDDGVNVITAYVTDQAGNAATNPSGTDIVNTSIGADDDDDLDIGGDGFDPVDFASDGFVFTAEVDDDAVTNNTGDNNVGKSDGTVTLKATADLTNSTTANPFDAVHFYAAVSGINTGLATDENNDRTELRLIKTVIGVNGILKTGTERVWTYEVDASADDIYALVGASAAGDYTLYAIGVNDSGVALVSAGVVAGFAKR